MPQIDLEKLAANGKPKLNFVEGIKPEFFAFYSDDSLHLGFVTQNYASRYATTKYFDSTNGKGEVKRVMLTELNRQLKKKQIAYVLKIAPFDFLNLMEEDNLLFAESLAHASPMEKVVSEKYMHYFSQIHTPIENDINSITTVVNTPALNATRYSAMTNYFILENARVHNYGRNFVDFDWLNIITAEPTNHLAIKSAMENNFLKNIGMQTISKFKIHELPKEIITPDVEATLKQHSCIPLNNGCNIQASILLAPKEKHKYVTSNPLQYSLNFEN